ncbi:MAG TPA: response regulator [Burkholderiaceae bacterium]|nr:response regulator [Burkholderiaceae bacterium]
MRRQIRAPLPQATTVERLDSTMTPQAAARLGASTDRPSDVVEASAADTVRVLLVDDHRLCQSGLAELLERSGGFAVAGATGNPIEAEQLACTQAPDLLILDMKMPQLDGVSLLRRLRAAGVDAPAVILTMSDTCEDLGNALRAGVRGYLLKDMDPQDIVAAIRRAAKGELVVAPAIAGKLAQVLQSGAEPPHDKAVKLTEREREILRHLSSGKSNKAIAKVLNISHDTVKLHVRHILAKLNMTSRVEAAVFAVEHAVADHPTRVA